MIRTVLVDDEANSIMALEYLITQHCPELTVVEKCSLPELAIEIIENQRPDLIFLDIEMPVISGFELLRNLKNYFGTVIFTTAYHQYAIEAIKHSAFDYLLKPVDPKELIQAVSRLIKQKGQSFSEQLQILIENVTRRDGVGGKIAIPNFEGFKLVSMDDIIFCMAENNYTILYLKNNTKIIASKTLKEVQHLFGDNQGFIRVHHSYLINIKEVTQYMRADGGYIIMSNGMHVSISRNRKEAVINRLMRRI